MKSTLSLLIILITFATMAQSQNIYDYSFTSIDGEEMKLDQFKGRKILFVNVASKCGYTPQYAELQELHEKYGDHVVLIGFPCNQFMGQEPKEEAEIKSFCQKNYGVTFLMASKIEVKGKEQDPIYKWLTEKSLNGVEDTKVAWNFQKYLVDEEGKYLKMFAPGVKPMDEEITKELN